MNIRMTCFFCEIELVADVADVEMLPPLPSRAIQRRLQQRPGPFNDHMKEGEKEGISDKSKVKLIVFPGEPKHI